MRSYWLLRLEGLYCTFLILLVTLLFSREAFSQAPFKVHLTLEISGQESAPAMAEAVLHLRRSLTVRAATEGNTPSALVPEPPAKINVQIPGEVSLALPPDSKWILTLEADGFWAPEFSLEVEQVTDHKTLKFYPAGRIDGNFVLPGSITLPKNLEVRFSQAPEGDGEINEGSVICPADELAFQCLVPAGIFDFRFSVKGFIPHYRWSVHIPPRENWNVGTLTLQSGASLIGWLTAPGAVAFKDASVRLMPKVEGFADPRNSQQYRTLQKKVPVNERGFFQLAGIAPGSYRLLAEHPKFSPGRLENIAIEKAQEYESPEISLQNPARVCFHIRQATDPFNKHWGIHVWQKETDPRRGTLAAEGIASQAGEWCAPPLAPGIYRLSLLDSRSAVWQSQHMEFLPGEQLVEIKARVTRLEGLLLLDGEPVSQAQVTFKEDEGSAAHSVQSREDGRFFIFLKKGKIWTIEVTQPEMHLASTFHEFEVPTREAEEPWPKAVIEIPNTKIEGVVLDSFRRPLVASANLDLSSKKLVQESTNSDGTFTILGVQPGEYRFQAWQKVNGRSFHSQPLTIQVEEAISAGPVELILKPDQLLEGLVIAPSNLGVPGARIIATFFGEEGPSPSTWVPETYTDMDGVFELAIPATARSVVLTILPPGFAVTQLIVPLPLEEAKIIPVDTLGGTLTITYESPLPEMVSSLKRKTLVSHQSLVGHPFALMDWQSRHQIIPAQDRFVIPMLAPGDYRVCFGDKIGRYLNQGLEPPPDLARLCSNGYLAPYGNLQLHLSEEALAIAND